MKTIPTKREKNDGVLNVRIPKEVLKKLKKKNVDVAELVRATLKDAADSLE
jgi:post-segregation antitoxin (ccd killing protein)